VAIEGRGRLVALLLVKPPRLDLERIQRDTGAAAPAAFLSRHGQQPAAEPIATQPFGKEETVDPELAEIAAPIEPAQNLARNRVGDEDRKRPVIVAAGLLGVVGAQPIGN